MNYRSYVKIVQVQLPLIRKMIGPGKSEVEAERTHVDFRAMTLVLFRPDPKLFVIDIIGPDRCSCFASPGEIPAMMFSQSVRPSRRMKIELGTAAPGHQQPFIIKMLYTGSLDVVSCAGFFEGVASL